MGRAEVLQAIQLNGRRRGKPGSMVAGSRVTGGILQKNAFFRVLRPREGGPDEVVAERCHVDTIRSFKTTVQEVKKGHECGVVLTSAVDYKEGDILQVRACACYFSRVLVVCVAPALRMFPMFFSCVAVRRLLIAGSIHVARSGVCSSAGILCRRGPAHLITGERRAVRARDANSGGQSRGPQLGARRLIEAGPEIAAPCAAESVCGGGGPTSERGEFNMWLVLVS